MTACDLCRLVEQEEVGPDDGYVHEAEEGEYTDEVKSLETIEEKGESECTPVTEHSSFNAAPALQHDADDPPQHRGALDPVQSTAEAVFSQFPAVATRDKAFWITRLAALEDSGEQFAFAMKGKSKIRYKPRVPKTSIDSQQLFCSATVGLPQWHSGGFNTPAPQTPAHSAQHTPSEAITPGVSIDMGDSNNFYVSPPLYDHRSEEALGSTQELSGSGPDSARRQEGSGTHEPSHLRAFAANHTLQAHILQY